MPYIPYPNIELRLRDECRNTVYTATILGTRVEIQALTLLVLRVLAKLDDSEMQELLKEFSENVQQKLDETKAWIAPYCDIDVKP